MTLSLRLFAFTVYGLVGVSAIARDLRLAAVGSFGEPLTGCRVDSFRPIIAGLRARAEYSDSFNGLSATGLPDGDYAVSIRCLEARMEANVQVAEFHEFELITQSRRLTRSDHVIPSLAIRMTHAIPKTETWWVTLRAVYETRAYTSEFRRDTGEAQVLDPEPGSYLVGVLSTNGYICFCEIDLVERTRLWTFDAMSCTYGLDTFAHVVTDRDKRDRKTTGWYRELRRNEEDLFRALEDAANGAADPHSDTPSSNPKPSAGRPVEASGKKEDTKR
jgi:hypothetical protein